MTATPYDQIAREYYSPSHKTSRNFDHATVSALSEIRGRIRGLALDVGAGRGKCNEYLGVAANRIVQLDSSSVMLGLEDREDCIVRVLHDAQELPFIDGTFGCVAAFLADGFWGLTFLAEAFRVLQAGGVFVATLPSYEWGMAIRERLHLEQSVTRFITTTGSTVTVPSALAPPDRLRAMLERVGFPAADISLTSHCLPVNEDPVSSDITDAAEALGKLSTELHILHAVIAKK